MARKPAHVIAKERARHEETSRTLWLFGLHAVEAALQNPARGKLRLIATKNAADRLRAAITASGLVAEIADPRRFPAPLEVGAVHQGVALEVRALDRGGLDAVSAPAPGAVMLLLDRVSDPHNVGAILRSAAVFGARAVIAPARHSAPETGALAKAASGALEWVPYLRVTNLARAMATLGEAGWRLIGLDGAAGVPLEATLAGSGAPVGLVLGAEGPGLRQLTRESCAELARIAPAGGFGSLNVSNAAAVALYAACAHAGRA